MKKLKSILSIIVLFATISIQANNNEEITLRFTASYTCSWSALDSIVVENITQDVKRIMHYPDTTLILPIYTGIGDIHDRYKDLYVSQNYPNPFSLKTNINIGVSEKDSFTIHVYDITGKKLTSYQIKLDVATHSFTFHACNKQAYILTINSEKHSEKQLMLQAGQSNKSSSKIVYNGPISRAENHQKKTSSDFPFNPGDILKFTGHIDDYNDAIVETPTEDTDYIFDILNTAPQAPLATAGTDIEENHFTANWEAVTGFATTNYLLDVSTEADFSSYVYEKENVGDVIEYQVTELETDTEYHYRVFAVNNCGNSPASNTISIETGIPFDACEGVTPPSLDGYTYNIIGIGNQCWFAENLRYDNGCASVPWIDSSDEGWCGFYEDNGSELENYGFLYQWSAVMAGETEEGAQGICPEGWYVPTDDDWKELEMALGMTQDEADNTAWRGTDEGEKLKCNEDWNGTNTSGFTALPGGYRSPLGLYRDESTLGIFWTSSEDTDVAWQRLLSSSQIKVRRGTDNMAFAYSARCLLEEEKWEECGDDITFSYNGEEVTYGTVDGQNGTCWMDRNLGACDETDPDDYSGNADYRGYGDLFQWGRNADEHQLINRETGVAISGTTTTLADSDIPAHGDFIRNSSSPYDWRDDNNDNRWNADPIENNPCPDGWRIPDESEWEAERANWNSFDADGAFESPLKLTLPGLRNHSIGSLHEVGLKGHYWSSSVTADNRSYYLHFDGSSASITSLIGFRARGYTIRCIKD